MDGPTAQRGGPGVVVIGAGFGGLAAAIALAQGGAAVTLIEARDAPGGKARRVPGPTGPIDAGPTVLTLRGVFDRLYAAAGESLDDHLRLIPQAILARHWWPDGTSLDLHADPEASAAAIRDWAGARAEAEFRAFDRATAQAFRAFEGPMMLQPLPRTRAVAAASLRSPALWPMLMTGRTLARDLAARFTDPRLRQLFGRFATYVGGLPELSPAVLGLIWRAEAQGVWAVEGGIHALALALAALARRLGVDLRLGTPAVRIAEAEGRATGVELADGTHLGAGHVVFAGDPAALAAGLLGQPARAAVPVAGTQPRSLSAQVWTFAARATRPAFGPDLIHHNVFFSADPAGEYAPLARGEAQGAPSLYLCAEDRAAGPPPAGPERFEIILNAPPLSPARPPPDGEFDRCRDTTLTHLARFGITLDPPPGPGALTTPRDFARLFPGSGGAIYGLSPHGVLAAFRRPTARSRMPGLYLAGGGTHPGAGVPMAARSGLHAAAAILEDHASTSASGPAATPGGTSTG